METGGGGEDPGSHDLFGDLSRGLLDRTRNLLRALDRHDRLEATGPFAGWLGGERDRGGLAEATRVVFLRALRAAGDPTNFRLLSQLDLLTGVDLASLMETSGLARVDLSERLHELVQTGLASRELVGDEVRRTHLATGLLALVEKTAQSTAEALDRELKVYLGE